MNSFNTHHHSCVPYLFMITKVLSSITLVRLSSISFVRYLVSTQNVPPWALSLPPWLCIHFLLGWRFHNYSCALTTYMSSPTIFPSNFDLHFISDLLVSTQCTHHGLSFAQWFCIPWLLGWKFHNHSLHGWKGYLGGETKISIRIDTGISVASLAFSLWYYSSTMASCNNNYIIFRNVKNFP